MAEGIRVIRPHDDSENYHELLFTRRLRADNRGHLNPRMYEVRWSLYMCNGCDAEIMVSDWRVDRWLRDAVE